MSDNRRRYSTLQKALKSLRPTEPKGNLARHLNTLALFVSGIVGSKKTSLPAIASAVPEGNQPVSRIRKMERWLDNDRIDHETYYLPYVQILLQSLALGPLVLAMDVSEVGEGCLALMLNLIYQKRALPLCWLIVSGKKGHLPVEQHIELVKKLAPLLPAERSVIFVGDGEFDGCDLLSTLDGLGWKYACRTAKNVLLQEGESAFFSPDDLLLAEGDDLWLADVGFTKASYGPVQVGILWQVGQARPLILVSNFEVIDEAFHWYKLRFRIETFFSDQKSRGFYLCHSHIKDIRHMERLLIACCLAYLWVVCLGALVVARGKLALIHRKSRCDWSLFHIGLAWIEYCLNEDLPLTVVFQVSRQRDVHECRTRKIDKST